MSEMAWPGRTSVNKETVQTMSALLEVDRNQTICELTIQAGLAHTAVLHILKQRLGMKKFASR